MCTVVQVYKRHDWSGNADTGRGGHGKRSERRESPRIEQERFQGLTRYLTILGLVWAVRAAGQDGGCLGVERVVTASQVVLIGLIGER